MWRILRRFGENFHKDLTCAAKASKLYFVYAIENQIFSILHCFIKRLLLKNKNINTESYMTMVAWLLKKSSRFYATDARSYTSTRLSFQYYSSAISPEAIQAELEKSDKAGQQELILARDKKYFWQNALHVVLSGILFEYFPDHANNHTIRESQLSLTQTHIKRRAYVEEHKHLPQELTGAYSSDESSDDSDEEDGLTSLSRSSRSSDPKTLISKEELSEYQKNHSSLQTMTVRERVSHEIKSLLNIILTAFADNDAGLNNLLATQDEDLNTPLQCALKSGLKGTDFASVFEAFRGKPHLEEFALKLDTDGRVIFHYLSVKFEGFFHDIFGLGIVQIGLTTVDATGQTPLHIICQDNFSHKLRDLAYICNMTQHVLSTQNSPRMRRFCATDPIENRYYQDAEILDKLFGQTSLGQNPLHLICIQTKELAMQVEIIKLFRQTMGEEKYYEALTTPDHRGNLPSHYAISNNLPLLSCLLADLDATKITKILLTVNSKKENALRCATCHATADVFQYVVGLLGSVNLYECRQALPDLVTEAKNNNHIATVFTDTIKKYNALFDCVDYFLQHKASYSGYATGLLKRLNDFRSCIQHIRKGLEHLPWEDNEFINTGWTLFSVDLYHDNRKHIKIADAKKELDACIEYFQSARLDDASRAIVTSLFGVNTPRLTPLKIALGGDTLNGPPELQLSETLRPAST